MDLVRLTIKGISYSQTKTGAYALILEDKNGDKKLPIIIGAFEAQAIAIGLDTEITHPRPLTHDLFKNFAQRFNISLKQVVIHKLVDGVFFSSIICIRDNKEEVIDARTSDAIALALRFDAPIFTYKNILEKAGVLLNFGLTDDDNSTKKEDDLEEDTLDIEDENEPSKEKPSQYASKNIEQLEDILQKAILDEDYELAASIRDEISKRLT